MNCCLQVLKVCKVGQAIRKGAVEGVNSQTPAGMSIHWNSCRLKRGIRQSDCPATSSPLRLPSQAPRGDDLLPRGSAPVRELHVTGSSSRLRKLACQVLLHSNVPHLQRHLACSILCSTSYVQIERRVVNYSHKPCYLTTCLNKPANGMTRKLMGRRSCTLDMMYKIVCCLQVLKVCKAGQAIRKGASEGVVR